MSQSGTQPVPAARFDLIHALRHARATEISRITGIAGRLMDKFGPATSVGFLYYEILGRPPGGADIAAQVERLRRTPGSALTIIVEELLAIAAAEQNTPAS